MPALTYHKNSPYYQIVYYGPGKKNNKHKGRSFSTKVKITKSDLNKIKQVKEHNRKCFEKDGHKKNFIRAKLEGNREVKKLMKKFSLGLRDLKIGNNTGVYLNASVKLLSECKILYVTAKTIPGDKEALAESTIESFEYAYTNFIEANGDLPILHYTRDHYNNYINFLRNKYLPSKKKIGYGQNSIAKFCRELSAFWTWCKDEENLTNNNPIGRQGTNETPPDPIPLETDLPIILNYFNDLDNQNYFNTVYYLLLTGVRESTASEQRIEWFDFKNEIAMMKNTKVQRIESKKYFYFPIFEELKLHLIKMGINGFDQEGELLHFLPSNKKAIHRFSFWKYHINKLYTDENLIKKYGKITKKHSIGQLRDTWATYLRNVLKMPVEMIQMLIQHSDRRILKEFYMKEDVRIAKDFLDKAKFFSKTA
ncbi:MAG: hypothetical protein PVH88_01835 [Ignavibacteria bacterium]|jgi:integrase